MVNLPTYAHTLPGRPSHEWELLADHLQEVAEAAAAFAGAFGASEWGKLLGNLHDLGKYSKEFQDYLHTTCGDPDAAEEEVAAPVGQKRVDHSTFGAQYAMKNVADPVIRQVLAFCIAGHHAGLTDYAVVGGGNGGSSLKCRLAAGPPRVPSVSVPKELPLPLEPSERLPLRLGSTHQVVGFQLAFFTRMLFSCLIDADRLATEQFCDKEKAKARQRKPIPLEGLAKQLDEHMVQKQAQADPTPVNAIRQDVLAQCLAAASQRRGFFSLNVPTGGGKTLASLVFALHHALHHQEATPQQSPLRRVVMAIPFTSIIEQTADNYRTALGDLAKPALVEHHSNIEERKQTRANHLASENWDAEVIVTTNVQLYESLFASRTTPCRKLHRLANSVIILDEAQTIPVELLNPTLLALKELVLNYGCSIVLCTATQPALERREREFEIGIPENDIFPIIGESEKLYRALDRVRVERVGLLSDEALVERLAAHERALCIVNSRPHASNVYNALIATAGKEGCYHLSTFMCAQHRREKLAEIRQRLRDGKMCRVISTQLIEAGVDIDFPIVYRAPAGFDSIAQAAGRCNREGKLRDVHGGTIKGNVYLFDTEKKPPVGILRSGADATKELIPLYPNPLLPDAVHHYFRNFYWRQELGKQWDQREVLEMLEQHQGRRELTLCFKEASKRYVIIRDEQESVLVPHDQDARDLIGVLNRNGQVDFQMLRKTQRYLVGVRKEAILEMTKNQTVMPHECGLYLLMNDDAYSADVGIVPQLVGWTPESLMS